jgi:sec-independent protein translocase protein TatB
MLDFSWAELFVVLIVAVLAIGPKQIPDLLYRFGRIVRRLQYMKYALTRQFDDFMDEAELKKIDISKEMVPSPPPEDESNFDLDHVQKIDNHDKHKKS